MIYFVQAGLALGPIKIGLTDDVETRLATLQIANPERLYVIATIPGDRGREARLHARFASGRLAGEWFDPRTPGLQEFISDALHLEAMPADFRSPAVQAVLAA